MTRSVLAMTAIFLLPLLARAQDDMHHHPGMGAVSPAVSPDDPSIKITINPEARVSVVMAGALPPPVPCGKAADLPVKIVNQGFLTSQLEAEVVGDVPPVVTLDFHPAPLKGVPEELRMLHLTLTKPGVIDLTLAFRAHNEIPDLGGRDRVHFLLRCLPVN
jgi:hypothetical protein